MSADATGPYEWTNTTTDAGPLTYVWTILGGAALGLVGGFLQAVDVTIGPISVPIWAVIVLAAMVIAARAITTSYGSRKPAVVWFLGWLLMTLLLAMTLPGGDQVITDGTAQILYLFAGVVLGSAFVSIPARLRSPRPPESTSGTEATSGSEAGGGRDA